MQRKWAPLCLGVAMGLAHAESVRAAGDAGAPSPPGSAKPAPAGVDGGVGRGAVKTKDGGAPAPSGIAMPTGTATATATGSATATANANANKASNSKTAAANEAVTAHGRARAGSSPTSTGTSTSTSTSTSASDAKGQDAREKLDEGDALKAKPRPKPVAKPAPKTSDVHASRPRSTESARRTVAGEGDAGRGVESPELAAIREADEELFHPASSGSTGPWQGDLPPDITLDPTRPVIRASGLPPSAMLAESPVGEGGRDF